MITAGLNTQQTARLNTQQTARHKTFQPRSNVDHHVMHGLTRCTPYQILTRQQKKSTVP